MRKIQTYLESGVIEAYCLGELSMIEMHEVERMAARYAAIRAEITRTDIVLRQMARQTPEWRAHKEKILHTLRQLRLEQDMTLNNLPLLTPYSDYRQWEAVVRGLEPTIHDGGLHFCVLQATPDLVQNLTWMDDFLEEDGHAPEEFQESFLVLEGECECNLGGELVRLRAGGYVEIPANVHHSIQNLRPGQPLWGIIQRHRVAA